MLSFESFVLKNLPIVLIVLRKNKDFFISIFLVDLPNKQKNKELKKYEAILIDSTISNGRIAGELVISEGQIEFTSESKRFVIPIFNVKISAGGAGNRLIFFTHTNENNISIYTSDKRILKNEVLKGHSHLYVQVKKSKKVVKRILYSSIVVLSLFVLTIVGLYLSKNYFVEKLANQVPVEWEKKAGDQLFGSLSVQYEVIHDDSLKKVFLAVADPLIKEVAKKGVKIDLYFVKDHSINAFALPGGKVVIQSGLIENAKSWEEVLGVLSHELAHVTRRHHVRGIIDNLGLYVILSTMVGDVSAIAGTFANMGGQLASLANSRDFETEADETGWEYLLKAKVNPKGMISFFETLDKKYGTEMDGYLSFMSTHPDTKERIKNLKEKLKEHPVHFKPISNDFELFKKALDEKMDQGNSSKSW